MCLTVTLLDGLVLSRAAMHHSANYRSVVLMGKASSLEEPQAKLAALRATIEHILPGRWEDVRAPSEKELAATAVLAIPIGEASAKIRTGPPLEDEEDYALEAWAGIIPLQSKAGRPIPDQRLRAGLEPPSYALDYQRSVTSGLSD